MTDIDLVVIAICTAPVVVIVAVLLLVIVDAVLNSMTVEEGSDG